MATPTSTRSAGIALVLGAALLWSGGGLGIKLVDAHPVAIAGYRSLFALPMVLAALGLAARGRGREVRAALRRPSTWAIALAYALAVMLFVGATRLTTAANAILLQYTSPVHVALLSPWLLRERVAWWDWLAVAGCGAGMLFFFGDGLAGGEALGNVLALVSGVGFGLLTILLRRERLEAVRRGDAHAELAGSPLGALVAVVAGNALGALLAAPWMITGGPANGASLAVLVALGAVQIGLSYVLFIAGTARVTAVEAGLVATIEPVLNPVWVALGYGELPSVGAVLGGALIVTSVTARGVLADRASRRAAARPTSP